MMKTSARAAQIFAIMLALSLPSAADIAQYKKGADLLSRGELQEAVNVLSPAAADVTDIIADLARYRLAQIFESNGDTDQAAQEYTRLCADFPDSVYAGKAFFKTAEYYVQQRDYAKAASLFDKAIELKNANSPKDAARYRAGLCSYRSGDKDSAGRYLAEAVVFHPSSPYADKARQQLKEIGQLHRIDEIRSRSSIKAQRYPRQNNGLSDDAASDIWASGFAAYRAGAYGVSRDRFGRAAAMAESTKLAAKALYWQAKAMERTGEAEETVKILKKLAESYPYSYYGARACERLNRNAYSEVRVRTYDEEGPPFEGIHMKKYKLLMNAELFDEAALEARQVIYEQKDVSGRKKANIFLALALASQNKLRPSINVIEGNFEPKELNADRSFFSKTALNISYPKGYEEAVRELSEKYGVDPLLVFALIREESRFDPNAISRSRAHGLTQIMPRTGRLLARRLDIKPYRTSNLFSPGLNLKMGIFYLSGLLRSFDGNAFLALASYNGGPGNVSKWLVKGSYSDIDEFVERIPLRETRNYVKKVLESYWQYKRLYGGG